MAEEVELKLALSKSQQARFLRNPLLQYAVERDVKTLDNIYYDTEDLALHRRGIALRLRRQGRDWLQTVKLAGSSAAGLSSRPEWEGPYRGHFDFSAIEVPAIRQWLERPRLLARIVPICETRFRRTTWKFPAPPGAVLMTLDRGWIVAAGRREEISEVELELAGAPVQAIFELAATLAQHASLTPSVLSKAERGYRLHSTVAPVPFRAAAVPLTPTMPPFEAFRMLALSCLEQLQQNHQCALEGDDFRYLQQMHIAMRRLRTALRLFAPVLPDRLDESLRYRLSALMEQMRRTRACEELLADIVMPVLQALSDEPRLSALAKDITNRCHAERNRTKSLLAAPDYGQTLLATLEALHARVPATGPAIPLCGFATERLKRLGRNLRRLARAVRIDHPPSLYALRRGVKRLRHAIELFAPLLPRRGLQRTMRRLAKTQASLDRLAALTNAGPLLMDCAGQDQRLREAVTLIGGWHGSRHAALLAEVSGLLPCLAGFKVPKPGKGTA